MRQRTWRDNQDENPGVAARADHRWNPRQARLFVQRSRASTKAIRGMHGSSLSAGTADRDTVRILDRHDYPLRDGRHHPKRFATRPDRRRTGHPAVGKGSARPKPCLNVRQCRNIVGRTTQSRTKQSGKPATDQSEIQQGATNSPNSRFALQRHQRTDWQITPSLPIYISWTLNSSRASSICYSC